MAFNERFMAQIALGALIIHIRQREEDSVDLF
jgi:hypothetical protein